MIGVMDRLKIHHLREGGLEHKEIAHKVGVGLRSVERVLASPPPRAEEVRQDRRAGKGPGRPSTAASVMPQMMALFEDEEKRGLPSTEILRLATTEWGYTGKRTALFDLVKKLRPAAPKEPVVRFEGVPGEFAQFDFGVARIRLSDGKSRQVTFFAGRLKYSRMVWVVLTADQQAESLVRAVVSCLQAWGGSPKEWVFDNPRTVRISGPGEPIRLHAHIRDLAAEMNVLPTLCTPRKPQQKGSVENLVGFVKKNFFAVRKFRSLDDVAEQLAGWLREVNDERPCAATDEVPRVLLERERRWLDQRPVPWTADDYPLRMSAVITPMATVRHEGTSYGAPAKRIGATATLLVQRHTIAVLIDEERVVHERHDHSKSVRRLPEQRREVLTVIHGRRKQNYFRRQCLLELGPPAMDFLENLIHRHPGYGWAPVVDELFELLQDHGERGMRRALQQAHLASTYTACAVTRHLRRAA